MAVTVQIFRVLPQLAPIRASGWVNAKDGPRESGARFDWQACATYILEGFHQRFRW